VYLNESLISNISYLRGPAGKFVIASRLGIHFFNGAFRFAHNACAAFTVIYDIFNSNPFELVTLSSTANNE
jgi:hypothetical protein